MLSGLKAVVLNLFCAVAHFEEPQIFVVQFLAVAYFDYVCDIMITKLLELASELMAAEVISKKIKGHFLFRAEDGQSAGEIEVDLQRKIRPLRLQFMGAGPYGCLYASIFLNLIPLANPLLKYANVCGPPVENQWLKVFSKELLVAFSNKLLFVVKLFYRKHLINIL